MIIATLRIVVPESAGLALWAILAIWVWMEMELFTVIDTVFLTWLFVNGWRGTVRWNELRRVL